MSNKVISMNQVEEYIDPAQEKRKCDLILTVARIMERFMVLEQDFPEYDFELSRAEPTEPISISITITRKSS